MEWVDREKSLLHAAAPSYVSSPIWTLVRISNPGDWKFKLSFSYSFPFHEPKNPWGAETKFSMEWVHRKKSLLHSAAPSYVSFPTWAVVRSLNPGHRKFKIVFFLVCSLSWTQKSQGSGGKAISGMSWPRKITFARRRTIIRIFSDLSLR